LCAIEIEGGASDIIYIRDSSSTRISWIWESKSNVCCRLVDIECCFHIYRCCYGSDGSTYCEVTQCHRGHHGGSTVSDCSIEGFSSNKDLSSSIHESSREYSCIWEIKSMNISTRSNIEVSTCCSNSKGLRDSCHAIYGCHFVVEGIPIKA
jgi:hypothetical protein